MLKMGWATRDFTPQRPAMVHGQIHVRIGRDAIDPLTLTALAIEGKGRRGKVIFISCDLTMVTDRLQEIVRKRLQKRCPEVPSEAIIMNGTHTHEAPVIEEKVYPYPGGDVMTPAEGMRWVADRAVAAAAEAWERRAPCRVGRAFGHAVVGHNRRAVYAGGQARMYGQTNDPTFSHIEGYEDHSLDMVFVWQPEGRLSGMILDIPCPSQVDEHLHRFSADFWHEIRVELRHRYGQGLFILPLCGAAGDQSPHFLMYGPQEAEMRRRRGLSERQEIAMRVGDAVARALPCTHPDPSEPVLTHICKRIPLSARPITREERNWAEVAHKEAIDRGDLRELWWPRMLRDVVNRFDRGLPMAPFEAEVHAVRLGDAVIVTSPFELFLDYGLQIKARSAATQTIVAQLAAGRGLYLPTERAVRGGHYGAHPVVAPVGPQGGRELVEATLLLIRGLFPAGS